MREIKGLRNFKADYDIKLRKKVEVFKSHKNQMVQYEISSANSLANPAVGETFQQTAHSYSVSVDLSRGGLAGWQQDSTLWWVASSTAGKILIPNNEVKRSRSIFVTRRQGHELHLIATLSSFKPQITRIINHTNHNHTCHELNESQIERIINNAISQITRVVNHTNHKSQRSWIIRTANCTNHELYDSRGMRIVNHTNHESYESWNRNNHEVPIAAGSTYESQTQQITWKDKIYLSAVG